MNKTLLFVLLILFSHVASAQNLVTNGSFELTNACPLANFHYIDYRPAYTNFPTVVDWIAPGRYTGGGWMHPCGDIHTGVPNNAYGVQEPHSGRAYGVMWAEWTMTTSFGSVVDSAFNKPMISTYLSEAMKEDSTYFVRFYVSPSFNGYNWSGGKKAAMLNELGANLSVARPEFGNLRSRSMRMRYDIKNDPARNLDNDTIWYEISGIFKAAGGERWLTLGYLDSLVPGTFDRSYRHVVSATYVDDVSVLPVFTTRQTITDCDSALSGKALLESSMAGGTYQWSTGDTSRSIRVFQPGTYRCAAYNDSVYTIDSFSVLPKRLSSYSEVEACDSAGVPVRLQADLAPALYKWSTGDTGRVIVPVQPALYTCVSSNACAIRTDSFLVAADTVLNYHYRPVCDTIGLNLVLQVKSSPYYAWSTGETTPQIRATRTGTYVCRSFDGCHFATDSFRVVLVLPERPIVRDTGICQFADSPRIQLNDTGLVWYTTATSLQWMQNQPEINTSARGTTVMYVARKIGDCISDRVPLTVQIHTTPRQRPTDTLNICDGLIIPFGIGYPDAGDLSYRWNTGDDNVAILPQQITEYTRLSYNQCGEVTDTFRVVNQSCDRCVFFPTAFSPNGDSRNDRFGPLVRCNFEKYSLSIFNRWGERVFYTTDMADSWDGTYKGVQAPVGTYMYMSTMFHSGTDWKLFRKGDLILIR